MKVDYTKIVRNQSSREGGRAKAIILHTTEGPDNPGPSGYDDIISLGNYFDIASVEASSHFAVNVRGKVGKYVETSQKSWACCNYNQTTVNFEQIAYAAFSRSDWFERHDQLEGTARLIASVSKDLDIPIQRAKAKYGAITKKGVGTHKQLGEAGCGHVDPGSGYPFRYVLNLARYYKRGSEGTLDTIKGRLLIRRLNSVRKKYKISPLHNRSK